MLHARRSERIQGHFGINYIGFLCQTWKQARFPTCTHETTLTTRTTSQKRSERRADAAFSVTLNGGSTFSFQLYLFVHWCWGFFLSKTYRCVQFCFLFKWHERVRKWSFGPPVTWRLFPWSRWGGCPDQGGHYVPSRRLQRGPLTETKTINKEIWVVVFQSGPSQLIVIKNKDDSLRSLVRFALNFKSTNYGMWWTQTSIGAGKMSLCLLFGSSHCAWRTKLSRS